MRRVDFTGDKVGQFFVRERISQGGMADVYRAYQSSVNREVALKLIPFFGAPDHKKLQSRFKQEAEMVALLEHPHILPIFDYGVSGDVLFLAMRYLRGGTLREQLHFGSLPLSRIAELFEEICSALGYAHRRGVIHRDIKPSNILLDDDGHAYLADFGLARLLGGSSQLTATGSIIGTPAYMSPEQLRGDSIGQLSDIYSLGVVLYHMLCGRPPFEALTTFSLIYQHVEIPPPTPRQINAAISVEMEAVILKALQKKPRDRFASVEVFYEAFAAALGTMSSDGGFAPGVAMSLDDDVSQFPQQYAADGARPVANHASLRTVSAGKSRLNFALLFTGVVTIVAVVIGAMMILMYSRSFQPPSAVIENRVGSVDDVVPDAADVRVARRVLGEDGFIAFVTCNQSSEFFARQARRMADIAESYGIDFRVYDGHTDPNEEIIQIERARLEGAQALVVCVISEDVLRITLQDVVNDGIPLVLQNISEVPSYGGVIITHDEYELGYKPGEYIGQIVAAEMGGEADVVILDFPDLPAIVRRADGLQDGLLSYAPNVNIIGRYKGGISDYGYREISELLAAGTAFDVILSINDAGAYGAIQALDEAGISPDAVLISGVDAEALAAQYIRNGYYMRVTLPPVASSAVPDAAINAAVLQLAGGTLPNTVQASIGELITAETLAE